MENCEFCGKKTHTLCFNENLGRYAHTCRECREKQYEEKVEAKAETVQRPADFKTWSKQDMSEAFWLHLGRYKKKPNRKSLNVMYTALLWAYHDDHGLSNSFKHALKWCGIDLYAEMEREDLPETAEEG